MNRTILVLGGTGAMGVHLVKILAEEGDEVFVTSRSKRENRSGIQYVCGDAHDNAFLKSLLDMHHYDAIFDFMTYTTPAFRERYEMFLSSTDQYFFFSTSRVYAEADVITEDSPRLLDVTTDEEYLKTDEYALCKARQEDLLKLSGKKNFTIIRPYMTYSTYRLQLGVLDKDTFAYRALRGRAIVVSEDIMQHTTTLTYGYDVAKCMSLLIGNGKAFGEAFHITTAETIPWMEVLRIYKEAIEKHTGKAQRVTITKHCYQLHQPVGRFQVLYDRMYDRRFDNSKILSAIGPYTFTSPQVGLRRCIEEFLQKPMFRAPSAEVEGTNDHYSKDWTNLCEFNGWKSRIDYMLFRTCPQLSYWMKNTIHSTKNR